MGGGAGGQKVELCPRGMLILVVKVIIFVIGSQKWNFIVSLSHSLIFEVPGDSSEVPEWVLGPLRSALWRRRDPEVCSGEHSEPPWGSLGVQFGVRFGYAEPCLEVNLR